MVFYPASRGRGLLSQQERPPRASESPFLHALEAKHGFPPAGSEGVSDDLQSNAGCLYSPSDQGSLLLGGSTDQGKLGTDQDNDGF